MPFWLYAFAWVSRIVAFGHDDSMTSSMISVAFWSVMTFMILQLRQRHHWVFKIAYYALLLLLFFPILYLLVAFFVAVYVSLTIDDAP
ncbi:MAG: hypothetical protein Q3971_04355 [Moraxella sp.]|nr:hypothetical protein [Moraxella sp.]